MSGRSPRWIQKIGVKFGTLPVGSAVKLNLNGTQWDWLVVHQGLPSNLYDASCNGTWLLSKDIYEYRKWNSSGVNKYESSTIHSYLNSTFLNLFDSNINEVIKQVKIPYRKNGGKGGTDQSGANGLATKAFLLSAYEVGFTTSDSSYFPVNGAKLSYFESGTGTSANHKRIAKWNGSTAVWGLRSPYTDDTIYVWEIKRDGGKVLQEASGTLGVRPAIILPPNFRISVDLITYPAA